MVMAISYKEGAKINANTFELCIEVFLLSLFLLPFLQLIFHCLQAALTINLYSFSRSLS